ncbi:MAG: DUF47 family protein [Asgard group archaeon]|nr:DUF47 family protein [Asgard group archaeon]
MSFEKIWNFFHRQTEKEVHTKMADHLSKILTSTKSLQKAVEAWNQKDLPKLDHEVGVISEAEDAADQILAEIYLDFAKGKLKSKLQTNILNFISHADDIINYTKRAVHNFLILQNCELPEKIFEIIKKQCQLLHQCSEKLSEALDIYREEIDKVIDLTSEISTLEHEIDGIYTQLKTLYFDLHEFTENSALLVVFDHAIQDIEKATNAAEDAADILQSIVIGNV